MKKTLADLHDQYFSDTEKTFSEITKELFMLQIFEECIDKFLSDKIRHLDKGYGKVFISRFNARNLRQDAFHIYFCPHETDNLPDIQIVLATGYILDKKLIMKPDREDPHYIFYYNECIKEIFNDFGFTIEYSNE